MKQKIDEFTEHHENKPNKPRLRRLVRQNSTERAIFDALEGRKESFSLMADEGGVILRSPLFLNNALLNKIWDGGPVVLDRADGVSLTARDTRVTTSIMVQWQVLNEYIKKRGEVVRGSGFFARFLITRPKSKQGTRFIYNTDLDWSELEKFHRVITEILEESNDNSNDVVLEFDDDAKITWIEFVNRVEADIRPGGYLDDISDFASKVGEIVARVSAIFHYFGRQEGRISTDTVRRAIDVVCYHVDEFKRIFDPSVQIPQGLLDARKIHSYLHRHCWVNQIYCIPRNDVLHDGPVRGKDRFDPALDILYSQGLVWIGIDKSKRRLINLLPPFPSWFS